MTASEKRDFGYLNRVQKTHPNGPDMVGQLEIEGVRFQISGWVKISRKGKKYLSLSTTKLDADGNPIFAKKGEAHDGKN